MSKFIIQGGKRLEGEVKISGSKNAALPIIAATILNAGKSTLYNVPNIHDTKMMFEILKKLGGKIIKKSNKVIIDTSKINKYEILRKFEINKYRILSIHETNFKPGGEVVKEVSYLAQKKTFRFPLVGKHN